MASGDFWCEKHGNWNCMCAMAPGSITVSGSGYFQTPSHYGMSDTLLKSAFSYFHEGCVSCDDHEGCDDKE